MRYADRWTTVRVELDAGIAWVLDEKRIKPGLQAYERPAAS